MEQPWRHRANRPAAHVRWSPGGGIAYAAPNQGIVPAAEPAKIAARDQSLWCCASRAFYVWVDCPLALLLPHTAYKEHQPVRDLFPRRYRRGGQRDATLSCHRRAVSSPQRRTVAST